MSLPSTQGSVGGRLQGQALTSDSLLGDDFLQLPRLPLKVRDLAARRCTRRIAGKPLLTGVQELLGLAIMRQLMLSYKVSYVFGMPWPL